MKTYILLLCLIPVLLGAKTDDTSKAAEKAEKPPSKDAETEKPPEPSSPPEICVKCRCDQSRKTLDCSKKDLTEWFTDDQWKQVNSSKFETLIFDNNNFKEIKEFPILSIKKLTISHNQIVKLENGAFKNLKNLEHIDLAHNNLTLKTLIPEVFEGNYDAKNYEPLKNLKTLDLSYNELHSLNPDVFEHLPFLENLILTDNIFTEIDADTLTAITSVVSLKYLDLSYLELRKLPEHLFDAPKGLEVLNLTGNLLETIPSALNYAKNLKELVLDDNPLKDLTGENVFTNLKKLEKLSLCFMPLLREIGPGALSSLENLKELTIANNHHLSKLDHAALSRKVDNELELQYPSIHRLNIGYNNLSSLEHVLLRRWDNVVVDIRGNPWDCECQNEWLIHVLYKDVRDTTVGEAKDIVCSSPDALKGHQFEEIYTDKNVLRCPDKDGNHPEADGKILIGMLIGLLIGIPIALAAITIYRRGCFGLFAGTGYERRGALYKRTEFNEDYQI